jgi:Flp pilus assembly protein TadD
MRSFRKRLVQVSALALLWAGIAADADAQPGQDPPEARLDALLAQLAEPGRQDWERIQSEIQRIWSQSGSDSMDLLLERGNAALQAQDFDTALEYFSALTDHAPEFSEGWNARATTFFFMEEYSLSISDVSRVLALNPRHFGALQGLGVIFERMGRDDLALRAFRRAHALNPNQPEVTEAIDRLERTQGAVDL